ncbi:hypothetical protein GGP81_001892 [Salinibacter ruber]|nr:hypothetical protein [Salinibacter ruber]
MDRELIEEKLVDLHESPDRTSLQTPIWSLSGRMDMGSESSLERRGYVDDLRGQALGIYQSRCARPLKSWRRCVRRVEAKRVSTADELDGDWDTQDILTVNLTRAM